MVRGEWSMIKKILKKGMNRLTVFGILLIIQLAWFLTFLTRLANYSTWISLGFSVISLLAALWIISKDENPAYKIAWIIFIMTFPLLGGFFYLIVGHKQPSKHMRRQLELERKRIPESLRQNPAVLEEIEAVDARMTGQLRYIYGQGGYPVWKHTVAKYYPLGEELYADLMDALKKAEHFIFMEYFIVEDGQMWSSILEVLEAKAKEGVDVRFIYDDLGSVALLPAGYEKQLEAKGIRCMAFNPFVPFIFLVMNNRDHRKIAVVDGSIAFSGGINLADEYINAKVRFGHWKDTGFKLEGEAVWNYTVMFLEMWNAFRKTDESYEAFRPGRWHPDCFESDGYVQPYGDSPLDDEILAENVYMNILNQAKRYVYIYTVFDH